MIVIWMLLIWIFAAILATLLLALLRAMWERKSPR